jgi:hypothetical protein
MDKSSCEGGVLFHFSSGCTNTLAHRHMGHDIDAFLGFFFSYRHDQNSLYLHAQQLPQPPHIPLKRRNFHNDPLVPINPNNLHHLPRPDLAGLRLQP